MRRCKRIPAEMMDNIQLRSFRGFRLKMTLTTSLRIILRTVEMEFQILRTDRAMSEMASFPSVATRETTHHYQAVVEVEIVL